MAFSYLTKENLSKRYQAAKEYTDKLTEPFPEFERLARNLPKADIADGYPKVTDGTLASIIRKTPRRIVQQIPTGKIESDNSNSWLNIVAEFILTNKIIPYANEEYDFIQKCWTSLESAFTFGSATTTTPFLAKGGEFSTDMIVNYWGDVFFQPGKKSGYSCDYIFIRQWYQEEDFDALVESEEEFMKLTKKKGEKYKSDWDFEALKFVKTKVSKKDENAQTPSEQDRNINPEGIEVITAYQKGHKSKFFTFVPTGESEGDVTVIRTKVNKDPRGKMPVNFLYSDTDGSNPFGRGIVDLVGGLQNLIDSDMQMYQFNRALMLAPPIVKRGNFKASKIRWEPNAILDLGSDQANKVETLTVDTTAISQYPELYGLQKSQMLNLVSSPDTSISSEVGNPGFGKTPTAIKTQNAAVSIDDNYALKMFEAWLEHQLEDNINLYFAERSGSEELQLDSHTAGRLRKLIEKGDLDPAVLSEDNKIVINYDTATPILKFRIDASTSRMKSEAEQIEALDSITENIKNDPLLMQYFQSNLDKYLAIYNARVRATGIEDPELATIDIDEFKKEQEEAQKQQAIQEQAVNESQTVEENAPEQDLLQIAEQSDELDQEYETMRHLASMGIPDDLIIEAVELQREGYDAQDILDALMERIANA